MQINDVELIPDQPEVISNSVEGSDDSQDQPKDNVSSSGEGSDIEKFLNEVFNYEDPLFERPVNALPIESSTAKVADTSSSVPKEVLVPETFIVESPVDVLAAQHNNVSSTSNAESYTNITKRLKKDVQPRRKGSEVETELMLKSHQSDTSRLRKSTVAKSDRRIEKEQIEEIVQHFHSFSK